MIIPHSGKQQDNTSPRTESDATALSRPETDTSAFPLLGAKFHQPQMMDNLVTRPWLLERLDQCRQRPLTLVSAPAGYGKTMLVSSRLEASDWDSA